MTQTGLDLLLCAEPIMKSVQWTRNVSSVATGAELGVQSQCLADSTAFSHTHGQTKVAAGRKLVSSQLLLQRSHHAPLTSSACTTSVLVFHLSSFSCDVTGAR